MFIICIYVPQRRWRSGVRVDRGLTGTKLSVNVTDVFSINVSAKKTKHEGLHTKHIQALCTYTSDGLYGDFNTAVREGKDKYLDKNFRYNSLHFWLTDAIQILNKDLSRTKKCLTVYRRTTVKFIGEENKIIRLGSFSSTSHRTDLTDFGKETCFVIETCLAAYVADYSSYNQEEVLIPPYETFKITKKIENNKDKPAGLTDCKVVYELKHGLITFIFGNCLFPPVRVYLSLKKTQTQAAELNLI
uniref:NAD(P)(+)--arginine ADP-ribosyltransferase n=1 Tax=Lates calcarifer TaxID=8187 RepID=A0A4W6FF78_LATCA